MSAASEVLATARGMAAAGMAAGSMGNVSVRGDSGGALITPTCVPYELMSEDDLVRIDGSGRVVGSRRAPSREWPTHLAIYAARPDVGAVVHSHSPHALAWSCLGEPLTLATEELEALGGEVPTAPHAPTGSAELAAAVTAALGARRRAALMERHGAVGVGAGLDSALAACALVEHHAQVELLLLAAAPTRGMISRP